MYANFDAVVMRYSRSHVRKVSAASKFKKTNSSQLSKRAMDKGYNGHFTIHCAGLEKVTKLINLHFLLVSILILLILQLHPL